MHQPGIVSGRDPRRQNNSNGAPRPDFQQRLANEVAKPRKSVSVARLLQLRLEQTGDRAVLDLPCPTMFRHNIRPRPFQSLTQPYTSKRQRVAQRKTHQSSLPSMLTRSSSEITKGKTASRSTFCPPSA